MAIIIVEDEKSLAELISMNLELEGYKTRIFNDGETALSALKNINPDLLILDIKLPGMNGFELQKKLKNNSFPVIFLTVRAEIENRLLGFKLGADDYITKPFDMEELLFRVKAVLRRTSDDGEKNKINCGPLILDRQRHLLLIEDKKIELTTSQFILLETFMANPGVVFSREKILKKLWNNNISTTSTRTVDMHIKRLREKLGDKSPLIKTIYGAGYKLEVK